MQIERAVYEQMQSVAFSLRTAHVGWFFCF